MKVCIIGAGVSGLTAARHCLANGFECHILESKSEIGGTWLYFPNKIDLDEYGFKLYSNMYPNLRTNLPKEVMSFPDFPHKPNRSFVTSDTIIKYLNDYADNFNLKPHIKVNRLVVEITPSLQEKWVVKSIDKPSKNELIEEYDSIMICTGVYNDPLIPKLQGIEYFKGEQMHSSIYRTADVFKNKRILVIGAGPSAGDILLHSEKLAKQIIFSHHNEMCTNFKNSKYITIKPDIKQILKNGDIEFQDNTIYTIDIIVYCTGYKRMFNFLKQEYVNLTMDDYHVEPLYKHIININHPSLCFIGLTNEVSPFRSADLQSRFYMQYLNGQMKLPSKEEMLKDTENELKTRIKKENRPFPKKLHNLFFYQNEYFNDLAKTAKIKEIPQVIVNILIDTVICAFNDIHNFREYNYTVIDDLTFKKEHI